MVFLLKKRLDASRRHDTAPSSLRDERSGRIVQLRLPARIIPNANHVGLFRAAGTKAHDAEVVLSEMQLQLETFWLRATLRAQLRIRYAERPPERTRDLQPSTALPSWKPATHFQQ
jgi:hypothetical protein